MPFLKNVFDKVVMYLYTGSLEFRDLSLSSLLQLEHVLDLMMLETAGQQPGQYIRHSKLPIWVVAKYA